jgi:hypothetical protein
MVSALHFAIALVASVYWQGIAIDVDVQVGESAESDIVMKMYSSSRQNSKSG